VPGNARWHMDNRTRFAYDVFIRMHRAGCDCTSFADAKLCGVFQLQLEEALAQNPPTTTATMAGPLDVDLQQGWREAGTERNVAHITGAATPAGSATVGNSSRGETALFDYLKVGDMVTYVLAGRSSRIKITSRTPYSVACGNWKFDIFTGKELSPILPLGAKDSSEIILAHLVKETDKNPWRPG